MRIPTTAAPTTADTLPLVDMLNHLGSQFWQACLPRAQDPLLLPNERAWLDAMKSSILGMRISEPCQTVAVRSAGGSPDAPPPSTGGVGGGLCVAVCMSGPGGGDVMMSPDGHSEGGPRPAIPPQPQTAPAGIWHCWPAAGLLLLVTRHAVHTALRTGAAPTA